MDGLESRVKAIDPEIRVLLATGHEAADVGEAGVVEGILGLLAKPYGLCELSAAIARHLIVA